MIPVGTSVNPGELRSGPKWEKTFTSCLGVPDTSPGGHLVYIKMYNYCVKKKNKTVFEGEVKCKEGCENCVGKIFLETYT